MDVVEREGKAMTISELKIYTISRWALFRFIDPVTGKWVMCKVYYSPQHLKKADYDRSHRLVMASTPKGWRQVGEVAWGKFQTYANGIEWLKRDYLPQAKAVQWFYECVNKGITVDSFEILREV